MSVGYYHGLLADAHRIESFRRAIDIYVGPNDEVLEIGTGLGTYAIFAAQAGAACVWAIDGGPILHVADTIAQVNGFSDRIKCLRGWAPDIDIPNPVQVLIFEDFASRLLDTRTYRMLRDSIKKYLEPGGRMVPSHATVLAAPLSSPEVRKALFPLDGLETAFDIDWSASYEYMRNAPSHHRLPSESVAGKPQTVYTVNFPTLPTPQEMGRTLTWELQPGTEVHALGMWFDLELAGGGSITNEPAPRTGPWGQMALPLDPPVVVDTSGIFETTIGADATQDGAPGWLTWSARSGDSASKGHEFAAAPAALDDILGHVPGSEGEILTSRRNPTET